MSTFFLTFYQGKPDRLVCKLLADGEPYEIFTYAPNGNIATKLAVGITTTYTCDMDNKMMGLSTSDNSQSASYAYANGNRLSKTLGASNTTYAYTASTNRLATATGSEAATYSYDNNGNVTGHGTHTYEYSQRERLVSADGGTAGTYSYDGDGRRVKKVAGGVTTLYFYDFDGKLLEEYVPATGAGKDYLWLPGTYEPLVRVDFSMSDSDNGNVLRNSKSGSDVHLDWSLDGN